MYEHQTKAGARLHNAPVQARHRPLGSHPAVHQPEAGTTSAQHGATRARSRTQLPARAGVQKVEAGLVASYDAGTRTALVRLLGAQANLIGPVPVASFVPSGGPAVGARCLVVLLDEANPADGVLLATF